MDADMVKIAHIKQFLAMQRVGKYDAIGIDFLFRSQHQSERFNTFLLKEKLSQLKQPVKEYISWFLGQSQK